MPDMNDFTEYYKTLPAETLLEILSNPDDYQPAALEAVKKELVDRQLSAEELDTANRLAMEASAVKEQQKQKIKSFEEGLKSKGRSLLETLNPVQSGFSGPEKIIRVVVIVFSILFFFNLIMNARDYMEMISDIGRYPEYSFLLIPLFIFLPIGLVTFWNKKRIGWVLLTIYLTNSFVSGILMFVQILTWKPPAFSVFDELFAPPPATEVVFMTIVIGTGIYAICRKGVRALCSVNDNSMVATLIITAVLSFFVLFFADDLFW